MAHAQPLSSLNPHRSKLTLHARRPKVLPCEEDGVIVVFIVTCIWLLLEVGPAADILQALRGVPDLNKAHGLQGRRDERGVSVLWTS